MIVKRPVTLTKPNTLETISSCVPRMYIYSELFLSKKPSGHIGILIGNPRDEVASNPLIRRGPNPGTDGQKDQWLLGRGCGYPIIILVSVT